MGARGRAEKKAPQVTFLRGNDSGRAEALCLLGAHAPPHSRLQELQVLSRHSGLSSGSDSLTLAHSCALSSEGT